MFEPTEDTRFAQEENTLAHGALRAGLHDLPTPPISADFDLRIQAALQRESPRSPAYWMTLWRNGWTALWITCRPALPAALCTLTGMLLLLQWMQQTPVSVETSASLAAAQTQPQKLAYRSTEGGTDYGADSLDLTNASLGFFRRPPHRATHKNG